MYLLQNQRLKKEFDSISNHSGPEMHSPQTPHKFATLCPGGSATPSFDDSPRAGARFDSMDVFMPAPEADGEKEDLSLSLSLSRSLSLSLCVALDR